MTPKSMIAGMDFDGAVVMREGDTKVEQKYDSNENGEWSSYNIETMLYSLKDEKLIWAGITETKNPKNPAVVVGEIAEETTKYLQKEGLIPKKKN